MSVSMFHRRRYRICSRPVRFFHPPVGGFQARAVATLTLRDFITKLLTPPEFGGQPSSLTVSLNRLRRGRYAF